MKIKFPPGFESEKNSCTKILIFVQKEVLHIILEDYIMEKENKRKYKKDETASEVRKKAKTFEKSRDDWKDKNREVQQSLKTLKKRMKEKDESRESWQLKYVTASEKARVNEERITELEAELIKERLEKLALEEKVAMAEEILKKKQQHLPNLKKRSEILPTH